MDFKKIIILFGVLLFFITLPSFALAGTWNWSHNTYWQCCGGFSYPSGGCDVSKCDECNEFASLYWRSLAYNYSAALETDWVSSGHSYLIEAVISPEWAYVECVGGNYLFADCSGDECSVKITEIEGEVGIVDPDNVVDQTILFKWDTPASAYAHGECENEHDCEDTDYSITPASQNYCYIHSGENKKVYITSNFTLEGFADYDTDGNEEYIYGSTDTPLTITITELSGIDSSCEGRAPGDSCGTGKICNDNCQCITTVIPPTVTTIAASSIGKTSAYFNGYLNDDGGEACRVRFEWWKYGSSHSYTSWTGYSHNSGDYFSSYKSGLDKGKCYHFEAQAENSAGLNTNNPGEEKFLTYPDPPYNVNAVAQGSDEIKITWSKGSGANDSNDWVRIRRRENSCPSSLTSGSFVSDEYGTSYTDTGLTLGTEYCYSLWSGAADGDCDSIYSTDYDCDCVTLTECEGNLSVFITGSGTCNVEAKIYPSDCSSENYRIREEGAIKWSGTLSGDTTITRTGTVGVGSDYDYDLYFYINGSWQWQDDDLNNVCPEEECNCTGWTNQSCDYSSCSWYEKGRIRTCTPSGCLPELECFCDESCCSAWVDQDCGPTGGCAETEMYQTRDCGTCSYSELRCVSDPTCGGVVSITPPVVVTVDDTTIIEDPAHPGKYQAILAGFLDSLGYDPGTCPNCKCIVWFEWGTSGTEGESGSYGNPNTPVEMTTEDDYFYYTADNLDPGTTFKFEAFAKNGGSW